MEHLLQKIKEYDTIIIHGHKRPDGDCYGSQFGLKDIINQTFPTKKVYLVGGKADYVSFLGTMDIIEDEVFHGALSICVDTATDERVDDKRFSLADYVIKVDHHIPVNDYGNYQYVDTKAPACAQIITEFYMKFQKELKISSKGAIALMTGIITDTGRFRFDSVNSRTFNAAAMLSDLGADVSVIDNYLSIDTLATLKLKGYVLSNFETTENGFAYIKMTRDVIDQFGVSDEEAASQVSTISTIEGYPVWALFMDYPEEIRIRIRSRGPEIDKLANEFGGGGHAKASGARLNSWDELPGFLVKMDELVKKYKEDIK